jgi:hypothetical protein
MDLGSDIPCAPLGQRKSYDVFVYMPRFLNYCTSSKVKLSSPRSLSAKLCQDWIDNCGRCHKVHKVTSGSISFAELLCVEKCGDITSRNRGE